MVEEAAEIRRRTESVCYGSCVRSSAARSRSARSSTTCRWSCAGRPSWTKSALTTKTTTTRRRRTTVMAWRGGRARRPEGLCSRWIIWSAVPRTTSNDASRASWRGPWTLWASVSAARRPSSRLPAVFPRRGTTLVHSALLRSSNNYTIRLRFDGRSTAYRGH